MKRRTLIARSIAVAGLLAAAGCSSSSNHATGGSTPTYTVGILTDLTGPAASTEASVPLGIKAGVGEAAQEGYNIKYVIADAATSPTGALTAAQRLVEQDHVMAVLAVSALTFAASSFLTSKGVPVIGAAVDGPEWQNSQNMFAIEGTPNYNTVYTIWGNFFEKEGATNIAALGYGITKSSALSTKSTAASAEAVGLKVGYLNANFPFGGTNVGPVALAIKDAGSDGYYGGVETSTNFALIEAFSQQGINMKAAILPIGYGGDLLSGGPDAQHAAQGVFFTSGYEPIEMHTAATERFQKAMATYAGVTGDPTFNQYLAYVSVDGFVSGLKAAGANPTQASLIKAMLGISHYDAAGLLGSHPIGFTLAQRAAGYGPQQCTWITEFSGSSFHLVPGAEPLCGALVPGKTVS
jgi:branched-chain amino acid transport system substrate-binding protein